MKLLSLTASSLLIATGLFDCSGSVIVDDGDPDGEDTSIEDEEDDPDTIGGDDTGIPDESRIEASITGTVSVQLYSAESGEDVSWEEGTGGTFPFGNIYVAAYYEDEDGEQQYIGDDVINGPSTSGDTYTIEASLDGGEDGYRRVYVYAVLDYYADNIVGSSEPRGTWPSAITIEDGTEAEDIDISIRATTYSSGGSCDTIGISGDVIIDQAYNGEDVAVLLMDSAGGGPYASTQLTPQEDGDGASGAYALSSCAGYGSMVLKGVWDKTGNGMFDPRDKWGAYIVEEDVDGNPITVGSESLTGYDIQIPLGGQGGISLLPFVRLSGTIAMQDGSFDDLSGGASVYVAALQHRPNGQFAASELEDGYDLEVFESPSGDALSWSLTVPADTTVYLWAYVDADGDGMVNESGEQVASGGEDDDGTLDSGSGVSGIDMNLATAKQ